uniref:Uncharacterized protein B3E4.010 n=1 Tax=Neurospora crassa TaxID=5141 RepID=Q96U19_NEUCS|nr:hypothetical protein [Neurospora crassa]
MSSPQLNVPEESPTSIPATAFSLMSIDMDLASSSTNGTGTGTPSDNVPSINLNYFPNNNHMAPSAISNGFHSMFINTGAIPAENSNQNKGRVDFIEFTNFLNDVAANQRQGSGTLPDAVLVRYPTLFPDMADINPVDPVNPAPATVPNATSATAVANTNGITNGVTHGITNGITNSTTNSTTNGITNCTTNANANLNTSTTLPAPPIQVTLHVHLTSIPVQDTLGQQSLVLSGLRFQDAGDWRVYIYAARNERVVWSIDAGVVKVVNPATWDGVVAGLGRRPDLSSDEKMLLRRVGRWVLVVHTKAPTFSTSISLLLAETYYSLIKACYHSEHGDSVNSNVIAIIAQPIQSVLAAVRTGWDGSQAENRTLHFQRPWKETEVTPAVRPSTRAIPHPDLLLDASTPYYLTPAPKEYHEHIK